MMNGKGPETRDFDLVLMCLPHSWLATMRWDGEQLRKSMVKHVAYFDRPAHYLRVSILFDYAVLGREDPGRLVHVGSVRRLLRLQRRRAPRRRQARRAELADRRLRRAGFRQSRRPGTDRRRAEVAAGFARQCPRAFHRGQDPSLAVVGQCAARRHAGARRHDQSPAGAEAASRPGRGRRLSVQFDPERAARFLRCRHRHHRHRDDAAAPRARRGRQAAVRQDRSRLFRELPRAWSLQRGLEPVHRSRPI